MLRYIPTLCIFVLKPKPLIMIEKIVCNDCLAENENPCNLSSFYCKQCGEQLKTKDFQKTTAINAQEELESRKAELKVLFDSNTISESELDELYKNNGIREDEYFIRRQKLKFPDVNRKTFAKVESKSNSTAKEPPNSKNNIKEKTAWVGALIFTLTIVLSIFIIGGDNESGTSNFNINDEQVCLNHIQGKWHGKYYLRIPPYSEINIRVLIEGDRITTWQKFTKDVNSGRKWNYDWSEASIYLNREKFIVDFPFDDFSRDIIMENSVLSSGKFKLSKYGLSVQRHGLKKGWNKR